jgi:hypothetical protein
MVRSSSILLLALGAMTASIVSASSQTATEAQKEALRSHCRSDFIAHCMGVPTGGVKAFECLEKNVDSLSSTCQAAVKAVDPEGK